MVLRAKPVVCIVTPGTRTANNGNWRTAARWAAMLHDRCKVIVQTDWDGAPADALVALHARRSARSVREFHRRMPGTPIVVALTGTDLYRDLPGSREAAESLDLADRIVVLQEEARRCLAAPWRAKSGTIFQSATPLARKRKPRGRLDCVAVGHLRPEKDPRTLFEALALLPSSLPIRVRHIGAALDPKLGAAAKALARRDERYRFCGALPHGLARAAMRSAHVLVHPSIMEGGANVIVEAVTAGTPVIASRIPGNVGMLGAAYPGYFEPRDASGLAARFVQALEAPAYLETLARACDARARLFNPAAEARAIRGLVREILA